MLKALEHLEAATEHRVIGPMRSFTVDVKAEPPRAETFDTNWSWMIEAKIWFRAVGPEDARETLMQNARRSIARRIFGEVEDEVRKALEDLWEEGAYRSKAAERLEALLPQLRGEQ